MKNEGLRRGFTESEYLITERQEVLKNEFFKGVIFAMFTSGSNHKIIDKNLSGLLSPVLLLRECTGFMNSMRLHIPKSRLYTYSDFMMVCGLPELMPGIEADTLLNPVLIIEILSPYTKFYAQGRKFSLYQAIPALRQYILIDSTLPHTVETFSLNKENSWISTKLSGAGSRLTIDSLAYSCSLEEVYRETIF